MREEAVVAARDELVVYDLVAYQAPLTQVLSLPRARVERGGPAAGIHILYKKAGTR